MNSPWAQSNFKDATIFPAQSSLIHSPAVPSRLNTEHFKRFCALRPVLQDKLYTFLPETKSHTGKGLIDRSRAAFDAMLRIPTGDVVPSNETRCFEETWERRDDLPRSPQAMQGDELRTWVLSATRKLRLKVRVLMFVGRRSRMKLAIGYTIPNMKVHGGVIDQLVLLKKTTNKLDSDYIDCLASHLNGSGVIVEEMRSFASAFRNLSVNTIYIKIDDDTAFISTGTFEILVFYVAHAHYSRELSDHDLEVPGIHDHVGHFSGFTANSVNNPPLGWLHEHMGYWKTWTKHKSYSGSRYSRHHQITSSHQTSFVINHAAFLNEWCSSDGQFTDTLKGKCEHDSYYVYDLNACQCQPGNVQEHKSLCFYGLYKTILNFYSFAGKEIQSMSSKWGAMERILQSNHVSGSDESVMTMAIPHALGKSVGLVPSAIVSHLAKLKQNSLPEPLIMEAIDAYREIMEIELGQSSTGGAGSYLDTGCNRV